jgi:hypothetical protein
VEMFRTEIAIHEVLILHPVRAEMRVRLGYLSSWIRQASE